MKIRAEKMLKKGKYEYTTYRVAMRKDEYEKLAEVSSEWIIEKVDKDEGIAVLRAVK